MNIRVWEDQLVQSKRLQTLPMESGTNVLEQNWIQGQLP